MSSTVFFGFRPNYMLRLPWKDSTQACKLELKFERQLMKPQIGYPKFLIQVSGIAQNSVILFPFSIDPTETVKWVSNADSIKTDSHQMIWKVEIDLHIEMLTSLISFSPLHNKIDVIKDFLIP